jgi:hypothetical protein
MQRGPDQPGRGLCRALGAVLRRLRSSSVGRQQWNARQSSHRGTGVKPDRRVVSGVRDAAGMAEVIVYPPDESGGRAVRVDGLLVGRAFEVAGIGALLAGAGLPGVDVVSAGWIVWRGGGPEQWVH